MMRRLSSFALFAAFAVAVATAPAVLVGCGNDAPTPDERLVSAYVEVRMVEQTYGGESPAARLARKTVLEKYGYTRESFAAACDKVLDDETMWVPFQQAVVDRIDSLLGIPKATKDPKKKEDKK
ncbi:MULTISPECIES: hypothetical protein [Fibrobacter]|uniref:hypothetical protein n=1 Tax=Fibrobacter TaxID=832 RepID=UPI0015634C1D|nr:MULTISPECIES: hypothetical protein [Fibrobacter]MBR4786136.1 hypothetical protein [Fibrobacter sp.]